MVFTHVTMQSEKFVCVRETGANNNVVIVDMANPTAPTRRPITADSTILAPSSKTLALKAAASADGSSPGDNLQVFNLDTKQKLKAHLNPEKVQFWTWLNDKTIGLVTENAVYHWNMEVRPDTLAAELLSARLDQRAQRPRCTCRAATHPLSISTGRRTSTAPRSSATGLRPMASGARLWALHQARARSA